MDIKSEKEFYGNKFEKFNKLLLMPEAMIIYRFYFEGIGLTEEWCNIIAHLRMRRKML